MGRNRIEELDLTKVGGKKRQGRNKLDKVKKALLSREARRERGGTG